MRRLLLPAVLVGLASCQSPLPPPQAEMTPRPMAERPAGTATAAPIGLMAAPTPLQSVPPQPAAPATGPFFVAAPFRPMLPARPGQLALSNFTFPSATIEAVATANPDCNYRDPGVAVSDFRLPLNATRVIAAPPGADVCWRRQYEPRAGKGRPGWSEWNRAYLSVAGRVDQRL